jgi:OmpR family response regulator RpaB
MREIYNYHPDTVMIIISGYGSLESAITALRLGVKDYFIKPYQVDELLNAIYRALTAKETRVRKEMLLDQLSTSLEQLKDLEGIRSKALPARRVLSLPAGVMVDLERREIWRGNERVSLTPTESNLLGIFLENRGRVLSHGELVLLVQGIQVKEEEAPEILRPMVSRLRKKLVNFPGTDHWISNVRGIGYAFDPI